MLSKFSVLRNTVTVVVIFDHLIFQLFFGSNWLFVGGGDIDLAS